MARERIEVYKAPDGWRWRFKAGNGRIVADSGEGYRGRTTCLRGLEKITGIPGSLVHERDAAAAAVGVTLPRRGKVIGLNRLVPVGPATSGALPSHVQMVPVIDVDPPK